MTGTARIPACTLLSTDYLSHCTKIRCEKLHNQAPTLCWKCTKPAEQQIIQIKTDAACVSSRATFSSDLSHFTASRDAGRSTEELYSIILSLCEAQTKTKDKK